MGVGVGARGVGVCTVAYAAAGGRVLAAGRGAEGLGAVTLEATAVLGAATLEATAALGAATLGGGLARGVSVALVGRGALVDAGASGGGAPTLDTVEVGRLVAGRVDWATALRRRGSMRSRMSPSGCTTSEGVGIR